MLTSLVTMQDEVLGIQLRDVFKELLRRKLYTVDRVKPDNMIGWAKIIRICYL